MLRLCLIIRRRGKKYFAGNGAEEQADSLDEEEVAIVRSTER